MTWGEVGQVTTIVAPALFVVGLIVKRTRELYVKPQTVEAQQAESRAVVAETPQWLWRGLNDAECESLDDPVFALMHEISVSPHQAQM